MMRHTICCCSLAGTQACLQCQQQRGCALYPHVQHWYTDTIHVSEPIYQTRVIGVSTKDAQQIRGTKAELLIQDECSCEEEQVHPI